MEDESDEMEDAIMLCEAAAELGPMIIVVVNVVNGEDVISNAPDSLAFARFVGRKKQF
jgi:hypothetical protein